MRYRTEDGKDALIIQMSCCIRHWNIVFVVKIEPLNQLEREKEDNSNDELLELFTTAKKVEGCSEKTLKYYVISKICLNTVINLCIILQRMI